MKASLILLSIFYAMIGIGCTLQRIDAETIAIYRSETTPHNRMLIDCATDFDCEQLNGGEF